MNIEWNNLRPFNGDIKHGFEELICQLARADYSNKGQFIRAAAPDGGVECYCILPDKSEYGWQAKFFTKMGVSQWKQLEDSFKTAIDKHPQLSKYIICIPLDREDPRVTITKGKNAGKRVNHFMDKWNSFVADCTAFAKLKGLDIQIEYWGNSEIFNLLSKPNHEGKLYYWFNQEEFSDQWFANNLELSIKNLDKRYTPEINFDLPIAKLFDGLARDNQFKEQIKSYLNTLYKGFHKVVSHSRIEAIKENLKELIELGTAIKEQFDSTDFIEINPIDVSGITLQLETLANAVNDLKDSLYKLDALDKEQKKLKGEYITDSNKYGSEIKDCRDLDTSIDNLHSFINGTTVKLSNDPCLLLTGDAGKGKSHLLADIAEKRSSRGLPTILLLGQHFNNDEPWSQIKKMLQLNCDRDILLSSLNAKGESIGSRVLLFIDAINEGEGKKLWKNHIAGFITSVKKYPYLGLVFSVRSSYEKLLVPDSVSNEIVKEEHQGFADHEYDASKLFFSHYNIKQPSIPLLHPEFSNPLFLKLFCEGLFNKGLNEIPVGYEGISTIINFLLESINTKLSNKHNVPEKIEVVQKVVKEIASYFLNQSDRHMKYEDAFAIIIATAKLYSISEPAQFFQDLISEGIITENAFFDTEGNSFEGIYFSYERFGDHLICSYLLEKYLDKNNPTAAFKKGGRLFKLLETESKSYYNKGTIEALSIQLPELTGQELFELAPHAREYRSVGKSFIDSIIWRKKSTFSDKLKDYINEVVSIKLGLSDYFLETILLTTSIPNHYFNSDFLHRILDGKSMADRDTWWMRFTNDKYPTDYGASAVRRIIDWAWVDDDKQYVSDESIRLMCQTMSWFLTSTNRILRDSATKAIICLLQDRINVLIGLLKTFEKVNDRYVAQRMFAIAYGCALRTKDTTLLKDLSNHIFETVFAAEYVIPDILLRDYARGVIEFAIYKGHKFSFPLDKIRPPYKSKMPEKFPTNSFIKKYKRDSSAKGFKDYHYSIDAIISSMNTNYESEGGYGDFGRYTFESALGYWEVHPQLLSNLAVKWILEDYGYDVEKHGRFDRGIPYAGRHNNEYERIGKKYQWIAFYDILARVADNFPYKDRYSEETEGGYEGPWAPYVRDIDPSIIIKSTGEKSRDVFWWNPVEFNDWLTTNKEWINNKTDFPDPQKMINVYDENGKEWLVLEAYPEWSEPIEAGVDRWQTPHKSMWYQIRSYIIQKKDHAKIIKWGIGKNFMGRWMPECSTRYELFSREYYWSPAWASFKKKRDEFSSIYDRSSNREIAAVSVTTVNYHWEEEFDRSKDSTISYLKPSETLFNILQLKYASIEGQLLNNDGVLTCFDPSVTQSTYSCLLVRKDLLIEKLQEQGLDIFWTVLGEKSILGDDWRQKKSEYLGRMTISGILHLDKKQSIKSDISFFKE